MVAPAAIARRIPPLRPGSSGVLLTDTLYYSICSGLLEKLESVVMKSRLYIRGSVPIWFPWRWQVLYYGNLNITIYDLKTNSGFRIPNNTSVVWFRNYYYLNSEEVKFTVRLYKEEAVWRLLAIITLFWNLHLEYLFLKLP